MSGLASSNLTSLSNSISALELQLQHLYAAREREHNAQAHPRQRRSQLGLSQTLFKKRRRKSANNEDQKQEGQCKFPPAAYEQPAPKDDTRLPFPWCKPEHHPPPIGSMDALATTTEASVAVPIVPSLLVPCCAHSGTTFLWRCMAYAYHPKKVCGSAAGSRGNPNDAAYTHQWNRSNCGQRKYLLPGLAGNIQGHWDYRKEWFFYGGGAAAFIKGWDDYKGVDLPLCYWEPEFQRLLRERPLLDTMGEARRLCTVRRRDSEGKMSKCTHRACLPLDLGKVKLGPKFEEQYDHSTQPRWQIQATKALPRVVPAEHPGALVSDMTPNYLCSPRALSNLAGSVGAPPHFRMLLLLRDPLEHITASYRMFVQWNWVRSENLSLDVRHQMSELRQCNETLYSSPHLLREIPDTEVLSYFGSCWKGVWHSYLTNALTYVCARSWIATGFRPSQFMLVRSADLKKQSARTLLPKISNFTGLHYNEPMLWEKEEELRVHCDGPEADGKVSARARINTHTGFKGSNAQRRATLHGEVLEEFERLTSAHMKLLNELPLAKLA